MVTSQEEWFESQKRLIPKGEPKKWTMASLENFGRIRLSRHFFMRDMLYSEVASRHGIMNVPDCPVRAFWVGTKLCDELLEPLHTVFGHVSIRSAFRSVTVNSCGNKKRYSNLAKTEWNYARHVWDKPEHSEHNRNRKCRGATACIVIPWFVDYLKRNPDQSWKAMAWWVHDHLNYCEMKFFCNKKFKYSAFNIRWSEEPLRRIHGLNKEIADSKRAPGENCSKYPGFPKLNPLEEHYAE